MAATINSGPMVSAGPMLGLTGTFGVPDNNPCPGPGISYQGDSLPDVRYWLQKDQANRIGLVPAHFNSPYLLLCDTTPSASAAAPVNLMAQSSAVSGTAFVLKTTGATGISPGLVLQPATSGAGVGPQLSSNAAVSVIGLDFGFAMGTTTAGTGLIPTVVRSNTTANAVPLFALGQWLCIGSVGNASGTASLFTQVTAIGTTGITVSPVPLFSQSSAPIGSCNLYDPNVQNMQPSLVPTTVLPYLAGGIGLFKNPLETCSRNVAIASTAAGAPSGTFTVRGYTVYGEPTSETITAASGSGTFYGKKAFKYIASVTPNFTYTGAATYSVGTADTFGFAVRSDYWEYTNLFWNGAFLTAQTGWLAADLTNPQTSTNGDPRGTLQVSARGAGNSASTATANGSIRLAIFTSVPLYNVLASNPSNPAPFYGYTPA